MSKTNPPRVVIFAGPNGAGKSTHADAILAALGIETFVNADFIARGLSGRNTDTVAFEAGRIMLKRLRQLGDAKADFAFESTLASRTFARCRAACEVARGHGWPPCANGCRQTTILTQLEQLFYTLCAIGRRMDTVR